ncbi:hypothetical protein [Kitasatospora purpeofusca]|uniref:hypothetical protein n=1 Tax=Kitasatospora purpeofusca TaxID=67352 RepID=UPI003810B7A7
MPGISYEASRSSQGLVVRPVNQYLDALRSGDLLRGSYGEFQWPALDIKIVNNTSETVLLHEAVLDIRSSVPDRRAVPVLRHWSTGIGLGNDGWGPLEDCVLTFTLAPRSRRDGPAGSTFTLGPSDLVRTEDGLPYWSMADALRSSGVDVDGFKRLRDHPMTDMAGEHRDAVRVLGPFAREQSAVVRGTLEYTYTDLDGGPVRARNPVEGRLSLHLGTPPVRGPLPPGYEYSTVLPAAGRSYRVPVPLSQVVGQGEADRFSIKIASESSAVHDFSLTLRYNDREMVVAERVQLELFLPRSKVRDAFRRSGRAGG